MMSIVVLSSIIAQTGVAIYLFNSLRLKDDFEKNLNGILVILFIHLGIKFFILVILKDEFLYNNNATGFGLSYGPLIYITARLVRQNPLSFRKVLFHLSPFLFFTILYFINSFGYILHVVPKNFIMSYSPVYQWLVSFSLLLYPVISYRLLKKASDDSAFSDNKEKLLNAMGYTMITGVLLGLFASVLSLIIKGYHVFDLRLLPYCCLAFLPVLILRYKMQAVSVPVQKLPVENQPNLPHEIVSVEKRYKKSAVDEGMMDQYEIVLKNYIRQSRIYLDAEASLEELADKTKIPKHHLTQLLNERLGKNFYSFMNEYRINEAIVKLKKPEMDSSILSLAYDCGFNSKSSFNNYFKKVTGVTPTAYRKELGLQTALENNFVK